MGFIVKTLIQHDSEFDRARALSGLVFSFTVDALGCDLGAHLLRGAIRTVAGVGGMFLTTDGAVVFGR